MHWDDERGSDGIEGAAPRHDRSLRAVAHRVLIERNEVRGADFDVFRNRLNGHFYPARVEPLGDSNLVAPVLSALHLKHTTLAYVRFGTDASVDPGELRGYHINVPLRGSILSSCGEQRMVATPAAAAVFSPRGHTSLPRWERDAAQLCVKVDRTALEAELTALLNRPVTTPVEFDLGLDLTSDSGHAWSSTLLALLQHCDAETAGAVEILEKALIGSLLMTQHHSYSEVLRADSRPASSRRVRDVVEVIEQSPEVHYTVGDLAAIANVSARALQGAFHNELGIGPMQFVRQVRLDRTRADLRAGDETVSSVAHRWGFGNLGRFAQLYRCRFGELPSETLSRGYGSVAGR